MAEKEEKQEKKERWGVGEVATQTAPVVVDNETKDTLSDVQILAKILNNQEKLMKLLD